MLRTIVAVSTLAAIGALAVTGCLSDSAATPDAGATDGGPTPQQDSSIPPPVDGSDPPADPTKNESIADSKQNITYRDDLAAHPGCTTADIATRTSIDAKPAGYTAAVLPDFPCSAKEYPVPAGEDTTKPIIVLVHGNSSTPLDWEANPEDPATGTPNGPKIAETLVADGYHVYAADFRYDKVNDPTEQGTGNAAKNFDHGWASPILERLIKSLVTKYPTRKINLAGFSLGTTIIRDALRRMHHRGEKPFEKVHSLLLISGANHGVSSFTALCNDPANPANKTMRGLVACQLGNRDNYSPTPFLTPLNGATPAIETPCADGYNAYGQANACGGNRVLYTTVVFKDQPDGTLLDEFVSERSAKLQGADNKTVTTVDTSTFFLNGLFKNHYGAIRSAEAVAIAKAALER
jgi:pimeloyl-ACP methyl ester carboxylesterase